MRILVFGAGVLGSLYAARLAEAGEDVRLLARGRRLAEVAQQGVVLENAGSGIREQVAVEPVEHLAPDDAYDLVIVLVRKTQLESALPVLAANSRTPNVLFMVSNPLGPATLVEALSRDRVLLGFAGAGGTLDDGVVRYRIVPRWGQPTTIGELDGRKTPRLAAIASTFRRAGFATAVTRDMDAWLKTHEAWITPFANAIYAAGGDNYRLARTREAVTLLVRAMHEGFAVLDRLGVPLTPPKFRLLRVVPEPILVRVLERVLRRPEIELLATRHANAARDEMAQLTRDFKQLALRAAVETPTMDYLARFVDPAVPPLALGSTIGILNRVSSRRRPIRRGR